MDNINSINNKSGKKLVQARLPFKLISSTEKNKILLNSAEKLKPKSLNSEFESEISEDKQKPLNDKTISESIIVLSDEEVEKVEDNDDAHKSDLKTPKIEKNTPDQKQKVFIKLPIGSKKKKRKCNSLNESLEHPVAGGEDEILEDKRCESQGNPEKKIKISDADVQPLKVDDSSNCDKTRSSNETIELVEKMEIVDENNVADIAPENENSNYKSNDNVVECAEESKVEQSSNVKEEIKENKDVVLGNTETQEKTKELIRPTTVKMLTESIHENNENFKDNQNCDKSGSNDDLKRSNEKFDDSVLDITNESTDSATEFDTSTASNLDKSRKSTRIKNLNENPDASKNSISKSNKKRRPRGERQEQRKIEKETKEQKRLEEKSEKEEKRRKEKEEKEKKRLAEIEAKIEEKRLKEEERKKKEEAKEEERRKREEQKEEDRRKREELKEEERRKKDEERRKKEDEKRKKELEREEQENRKKRAAENFTKFFVQSRHSKSIDEENQPTEKVLEKFMPFQVKEDMKLAPVSRKFLSCDEKNTLDTYLKQEQNISNNLYLDILKSDKYKPLKGERTLLKAEEDEIIIVDEMHGTAQCLDGTGHHAKTYKAKYFLFCENRRPPYYGTWRKKTANIKPRKPFGTDKTIFDYEVDSDLEWEEEEPGESLNGSDDEKESEDDYEVDNEFFVPHGHLSEEEMTEEDPEDPEAQKAKLKILQQEFAKEMKKKTEKLKPRLIGVVWANKQSLKPESCPSIVWEFLKRHEMIFEGPIKIMPPEQAAVTENISPIQPENITLKKLKRTELPEEFTTALIKLVHGNTNNKTFIINEFQAYLANCNENPEKFEFTKACIRDRIENMAQWKVLQSKNNTKKKILCRVVKQEILDKYNLSSLDIQNKWKYIIPPKKRKEIIKDEDQEELSAPKQVKLNENSPVITKFTKVLTKIDKEKLLENDKEEKEVVSNKIMKSNNPEVIKKRVPILFSVPRGQKVPEAKKNIAVNAFIKNQPKISRMTTQNSDDKKDHDECIILD